MPGWWVQLSCSALPCRVVGAVEAARDGNGVAWVVGTQGVPWPETWGGVFVHNVPSVSRTSGGFPVSSSGVPAVEFP